MEEVYAEGQFYTDLNTRILDIEEKQRILKDRILLIGKSLLEERENSFKELQDMKTRLIKIEEENSRMKSFIQRIAEQLSTLARKEDLEILQRQFDLFRTDKHGSN